MTIVEALKSLVSYPIATNTASRILTKRGLADADTFNSTVAVSQAFELAEADLYKHLVSATNISEGGFSVSLTDKGNMIKMASSIYTKYGESDPFSSTLTNASSRW